MSYRIAQQSTFTLLIACLRGCRFHSLHEAAVLHASARAICGGLVYVSDRLGEHDFSLLRRLVLPDGSVLRCMFPARPTLDCLFNDVSRDKTTVLKVFNQNALTGVIGAFNVQGSSWVVKRRNYFVHDPHPPALRVSVKPDDVHGLLLSDRYVLYSDALREVRVLNRNETWERELVGNGGCDLFVVSPLRNLQDDVEVAPIGLVNYLNAGGAIRSCHENQSSMTFAVKGVGEFWVYTSVAPKSIEVDGRPRHPLYDEARRVVVVHLEAKDDVCDHMVALIY
jgi:raffinose synthase